MKSIRKFNSLAEYNSAIESLNGLDNYLAMTIGEDGQPILDRKMPPTPINTQIKALKFTTNNWAYIGMYKIASVVGEKQVNIEYSLDGKTWTEYDFINNEGIMITSNDTLYFRGNNPDGLNYSWRYDAYNGVRFAMYVEDEDTTNVYCSGNIMHLLDYTRDLNIIPCNGCFRRLFENCTALTTAPQLPATTLTSECYYEMFDGCTSLVNAPELPATTLSDECYYKMFQDCTSLVNAPELPATTLANNCYFYMFYGCTKLQSITCLYEKSDLFNHTSIWVNSVPSGGTFYTCENPQYDTTTRGVYSIPEGWTVTPKVA